jgi:hypothetical protein
MRAEPLQDRPRHRPYTAKIMRADMAAYDADPANYTQSLGCWHGFIGQQKLISIKKHFGTTKGRYLYLSGWMVAALRSEFGPLPDQSMHEKTSVPALIEELYTFLRQADARELGMLFRDLDAARAAGDEMKAKQIEHADRQLRNPRRSDHRRHRRRFRQRRSDLPAGQEDDRGGRLRIQIENQVSDEKQCGHQDGKVTVPHEDFLAKIRACPLRLPRAGRRRRHHRRAHRLARRRPDQADRLHQRAGRHLATSTTASSIAKKLTPPDRPRRRHHQPRRQAAASEAPAVEPVPVPQRHRRRPLRARLHHLAAERR